MNVSKNGPGPVISTAAAIGETTCLTGSAGASAPRCPPRAPPPRWPSPPRCAGFCPGRGIAVCPKKATAPITTMSAASNMVQTKRFACFIAFSLLLHQSFLGFESLVHSLDEHVRGPRTRCGAKAQIVVHSWFRSLDLCQRQASVDHVLNTIANDCAHIAVVADI